MFVGNGDGEQHLDQQSGRCELETWLMDNASRIYGDAWFEFLGSSRTMRERLQRI